LAMARRMCARSFTPSESSMSRRIVSNSTASASISASLRWAYSDISVMAIDAYRDREKLRCGTDGAVACNDPLYGWSIAWAPAIGSGAVRKTVDCRIARRHYTADAPHLVLRSG